MGSDGPLPGGDRRVESFPCLDGVRALAAATVIAYHLCMSMLIIDRDALPVVVVRHIAALDRFGVAIFFMLSGFLLYRPYVLAQLRGRPIPRARDFWIRRAARILPGYWFALLGAIVLGVAVFTRPTFGDYLTAVALLQNYRAYGVLSFGLVVGWTLVIEVAFYALLPGIAAITARVSRPGTRRAVLRGNIGMLVMLAVIGVVTRYVAIFVIGVSSAPTRTWFPISNLNMWVPAYLDMFALGMLLALVCAWHETAGGLPRAAAAFARRPWAAWTVVGIMIVALGRSGMPRVPGVLSIGPSTLFIRDEVSIIAAFAFVLPGALPGPRPGGIRRLLAWKPIALLGTIAFGVYLWQLPIIDVVDRWRPDVAVLDSAWPFAMVAVGLSLLIAYVSYVVIEFPARELGMRLTGRRAPAGAGRWDWLRIDTSEHAEGIDRFVWSDEGALAGERRIVAASILVALAITAILPTFRAALG
ncbi:MAG: acyltransferase family protein [Actinomycetes bacterium]